MTSGPTLVGLLFHAHRAVDKPASVLWDDPSGKYVQLDLGNRRALD